MIELLLFISIATLFICSFASLVTGVAWMRYENEKDQLDAVWNDGITKEPKQ